LMGCHGCGKHRQTNWALNRSKIVFGKPPILLMNRVEEISHLGVVVIFFLPKMPGARKTVFLGIGLFRPKTPVKKPDFRNPAKIWFQIRFPRKLAILRGKRGL